LLGATSPEDPQDTGRGTAGMNAWYGTSAAAADPEGRPDARFAAGVIAWGLAAFVLCPLGVLLVVFSLLVLAILLLAVAATCFAASVTRGVARRLRRPDVAPVLGGDLDAIIGDLESGRLTPEQALRRVTGGRQAAGRPLISFMNIGFAGPTRSLSLHLPFLPIAMAVAGAEFVVYPLVYAAAGTIALIGRKAGLRRFLGAFPALPISRALFALLRARAPLEFGAAGARFSID